MSGRRSHTRYQVSPAAAGVLHMLRDVVLESAEGEQLSVISREPAIVGERLSIEIPGADGPIVLHVEVVESRAVAGDGGIRHRVMLRVRKVAALATSLAAMSLVGEGRL